MMGYSMHGDVSIRHRSGAFDVPLDAMPYATQFVSFKKLGEAQDFIDAGRKLQGQVVYDMKTQTPIK